MQNGLMGHAKAVHDYPLTEDGWRASWKQMVKSFPSLASAVQTRIVSLVAQRAQLELWNSRDRDA
jgi:hypothetical protein